MLFVGTFSHVNIITPYFLVALCILRLACGDVTSVHKAE